MHIHGYTVTSKDVYIRVCLSNEKGIKLKHAIVTAHRPQSLSARLIPPPHPFTRTGNSHLHAAHMDRRKTVPRGWPLKCVTLHRLVPQKTMARQTATPCGLTHKNAYPYH
ncbi:hypothetical protein, unlikely [Trypanosoma brucei gambiense DAL972]|uniref:Uncharacterized protein n=1 Tax=Trypanosoma brucei gambiense (strain MHOM/CI/86/DAL972) TaxID=679716 RepID=C9ZSP8_TRYB9|nr:hypothetical protein, unlikely [Trypanosoma brucei gambiense DAL972]CBH12432.1 hypothetical protein, unlikely [Trypanosoma brucei gambiense DAL972]|eukprot:XP_011774713.1 hypothetical protein, unlikely [Trypanosoma brucei gambiense DAL972]